MEFFLDSKENLEIPRSLYGRVNVPAALPVYSGRGTSCSAPGAKQALSLSLKGYHIKNYFELWCGAGKRCLGKMTERSRLAGE